MARVGGCGGDHRKGWPWGQPRASQPRGLRGERPPAAVGVGPCAGPQAAPSPQLSPAPQAPAAPAHPDSYFTEEIKTTWREPPPPSPSPWAPRGALRGPPPPRSHASLPADIASPTPCAHPRWAVSTSRVLSAPAQPAASGRPRGVPGARPWAPSSLPDASSDKTGGISAPKTAALSCLLLRNSKLILQSRGGGKGFVWGRRGRAGPADAGDQGWCGRLGRAWKPGGGDLSGPWG